jgi:uncharacterized membrane protein
LSSRQDLESRGIDGYSLLRDLVKNIDEALGDVLRKAGYTNEKYVKYTLVPKYRKDAEAIVMDYLNKAQSLHVTEKVLASALGLDWNWIRAAACLNIMRRLRL